MIPLYGGKAILDDSGIRATFRLFWFAAVSRSEVRHAAAWFVRSCYPEAYDVRFLAAWDDRRQCVDEQSCVAAFQVNRQHHQFRESRYFNLERGY